MKYLVMETHPAYAVLLDEEGRFLKAANLQYQVGDTVQDIVELKRVPAKRRPGAGALAGAAALAACLCLAFFGYYQPNFTVYGTLRIQINPDVEMTVSRTDRVLDLEGLNEDGRDLLDGYSYQGKNRDTATEELVERAIHMGYLSDGDTISVTVSSDDADWQAQEEAQVRAQLEERYGESIVIRLGGAEEESRQEQEGQAPEQEQPAQIEVAVPVPPPPSGPVYEDGDTDYGPNADGVTDYDDTDYGPNADGVTDYDDTDYGPNADGVTDYDDTDYGPNADGVTDYDDTDYGPNADGVTDYGDTDYGPNADGVTDYDDTDSGSNADGVTDYDDMDGGPYNDGVTDYEDRTDDDGGDGDDDDDGDDDGDD